MKNLDRMKNREVRQRDLERLQKSNAKLKAEVDSLRRAVAGPKQHLHPSSSAAQPSSAGSTTREDLLTRKLFQNLLNRR